MGPAGRVILVGLGADDVELPVSYIQSREIWLSGVFRYTNTWPLAIQLIADGEVDLDVLVTGRFTLAEAEQTLKAGKWGIVARPRRRRRINPCPHRFHRYRAPAGR